MCSKVIYPEGKKDSLYTINYLQKTSSALSLALHLEIITFNETRWRW